MVSDFLFHDQRKETLNYNLTLDIYCSVCFNQDSQRKGKSNTILNHFTILISVFIFSY